MTRDDILFRRILSAVADAAPQSPDLPLDSTLIQQQDRSPTTTLVVNNNRSRVTIIYGKVCDGSCKQDGCEDRAKVAPPARRG